MSLDPGVSALDWEFHDSSSSTPLSFTPHPPRGDPPMSHPRPVPGSSVTVGKGVGLRIRSGVTDTRGGGLVTELLSTRVSGVPVPFGTLVVGGTVTSTLRLGTPSTLLCPLPVRGSETEKREGGDPSK